MRKWFFFVLIIAAGCKTAQDKGVCDDFDPFFQKFISDSIFQKKHVAFPLVERYRTNDEPADTALTEKKAYHFIDLKVGDPDYSAEFIRRKDTVGYGYVSTEGFARYYTFAKPNGCWKLVKTDEITE